MECASPEPAPQIIEAKTHISQMGFHLVGSDSSGSDLEVSGSSWSSSQKKRRVAAAAALSALLLAIGLVSTLAGHKSVVQPRIELFATVGLAEQNRSILQVPALGPYSYNYNGPLNITGTMKVSSGGDDEAASQTLEWDLKGTDPDCGTKDVTGVANACGIHIHAGTSCAEDAGGHYHTGTEDPWKTVTYKTTDGSSKSSSVTVVTGLSGEDIFQHVVIVHDVTGAKAGCGVLMAYLDKDTNSTDTNSTGDMFDCDAGLNNAQAGWSEAKIKWCCESKQVACEFASGAGDAQPAATTAAPS